MQMHIIFLLLVGQRASQVALVVKNSPANAGDLRDAGLIPGMGRSPESRQPTPEFLPGDSWNEPGGLHSTESQRIGHCWSDLSGTVGQKRGSSTKFNIDQALNQEEFFFVAESNTICSHSFGHVWMWELDYKESWAPKNWCFWTVVLEKTLESPLDYKEIQPVHLKGDLSWVFIGRTDVETESLILWPPDVKSWVIWKDSDAEKDWGQEEKGMAEDEMVVWHHQLDGHGFG